MKTASPLLLCAALVVTSDAFTLRPRAATTLKTLCRMAAENTDAVAPSADASAEGSGKEEVFDKVEALGRGAAKVRSKSSRLAPRTPHQTRRFHILPLQSCRSLQAKRGKRKGSSVSPTKSGATPKTDLAPEETYYEGPPAITETLAPTLSILTVVGIIPAAAAWARQAWVRYKITNRRIRVTSGLNGKDMAEIVYPDIVELRTARRLFGDGDMVAFLRDGAKFEMRNIPEFDNALEFILKQVDSDVAKQYRSKVDVTKLPDGTE
jgi:hypothetical protein